MYIDVLLGSIYSETKRIYTVRKEHNKDIPYLKNIMDCLMGSIYILENITRVRPDPTLVGAASHMTVVASMNVFNHTPSLQTTVPTDVPSTSLTESQR